MCDLIYERESEFHFTSGTREGVRRRHGGDPRCSQAAEAVAQSVPRLQQSLTALEGSARAAESASAAERQTLAARISEVDNKAPALLSESGVHHARRERISGHSFLSQET